MYKIVKDFLRAINFETAMKLSLLPDIVIFLRLFLRNVVLFVLKVVVWVRLGIRRSCNQSPRQRHQQEDDHSGLHGGSVRENDAAELRSQFINIELGHPEMGKYQHT